MKFSIIVPVYNVEKYLPRCLDSVLDQEFDDYEIIAVDDESPDNSIDILNEYQKKTEKLKIFLQGKSIWKPGLLLIAIFL